MIRTAAILSVAICMMVCMVGCQSSNDGNSEMAMAAEYYGRPGPPANTSPDAQCPWSITGIEVGRWMNGKLKASTWAHGSFPLVGHVTERPQWYVNGSHIGQSWPFLNLRRLPNSSGRLRKGRNTIKVKFTKPPFAGATNSYSFNYDPNKVKPGKHVKF